MANSVRKLANHRITYELTINVIVYAVLTELPAVFLLYDSPSWSSVFLFIIFAVSVWNGGGFYIEVFGRKCVSEIPLCMHWF